MSEHGFFFSLKRELDSHFAGRKYVSLDEIEKYCQNHPFLSSNAKIKKAFLNFITFCE